MKVQCFHTSVEKYYKDKGYSCVHKKGEYTYVLYVVVQYDHWFKFYFLLFQTHYHTLPYPKTKGNKIQTKDKIEPQYRYI